MEIFKLNKEYSVGLYLRLSKEDGDKAESESISNQRNILKRFCDENNLYSYKEYVDDGYTGLNFDRPAFKQLIKDIEDKKINMVVTKDLSRLGRDYSGVGMYTGKYFPEKNVRYIAMYDGIDTIMDTDDMIGMRAVINDYYCRDASKKYRAMLYNKKKEGKYISTYAPYGYQKDPNRKGHLIIEPIEGKIVKEIFKMYIGGMGTYQIAKKLNENNVQSPATKKKNINTITGKWSAEYIRRMLRKEVYVGDTVLGKTKKINYKVNKLINLPEEEWIRTNNTHEPLVSRSDFELVQRLLNNTKATKENKYDYLLRGVVKCKDCGTNIVWLTKRDKYKDKITVRRYGVCCTAQSENSVKKCSKKYINYDKAEKQILNSIRNIVNVYMKTIDYKKILNKEIERKNYNLIQLENKIKKYENKINDFNEKIDKIYIDKLNNFISEEDYLRLSEKLINDRNSYRQLILDEQENMNNIEKIDDLKINNKDIKKKIKEFLNVEKITKAELLKLVDKIYIDSNKDIEIYFKFRELNIINDKL